MKVLWVYFHFRLASVPPHVFGHFVKSFRAYNVESVYPMESQDFFSQCKIYQTAWLHVDHCDCDLAAHQVAQLALITKIATMWHHLPQQELS